MFSFMKKEHKVVIKVPSGLILSPKLLLHTVLIVFSYKLYFFVKKVVKIITIIPEHLNQALVKSSKLILLAQQDLFKSNPVTITKKHENLNKYLVKIYKKK